MTVTYLNTATAHDLAPVPLVGCETCGLNPLRDRATWRAQCRKKQCDVLACVQPKDDRYATTDLGGGIEFTWCTTHGQLYDRIEQLRKRASHSLAVADALGVVA